jgi:hypothetical protein
MTETCECPQCNQRLEFDSSMAGTAIDCPSCQQKIRLPPVIPVARVLASQPSGPIQTKTNSKARMLKVFGALLMFVGVPGCAYGAEVNHDGTMGFWMLALGVGFVMFIVGRFTE